MCPTSLAFRESTVNPRRGTAITCENHCCRKTGPARNQAALAEWENSGLLRRRPQRSRRSEDPGPELRGDLAFMGLIRTFTVGMGRLVDLSSGGYRAWELLWVRAVTEHEIFAQELRPNKPGEGESSVDLRSPCPAAYAAGMSTDAEQGRLRG